MKTKVSSLIAAAALCAGGFATTSAMAQGQFTPGSGTGVNCNLGTSGTSTDSKSCTIGSVGVTMTAWGYTGATLSSTAAAGFQQGRLADWDTSGIGVLSGNKESTTGGQHGFDNLTSGCGTSSSANGGSVALSTANSGCGGSIEALFLDFGTAKVNLTNVGIGWDNNVDTDLSVWVWTGTGGPTMSTQTAAGSTTTTGTTAASLAGWTLVSNLDMGVNAPSNANLSSTLYSSYFLITTYFGAAGGNFNAGNDGFKLNSFTTALCTGTLVGTGSARTCSTSNVAEPGSLALAGLAIFGAWGATRRRRA